MNTMERTRGIANE
jgi:hypothetical protein